MFRSLITSFNRLPGRLLLRVSMSETGYNDVCGRQRRIGGPLSDRRRPTPPVPYQIRDPFGPWLCYVIDYCLSNGDGVPKGVNQVKTRFFNLHLIDWPNCTFNKPPTRHQD